MQSKVILLTSLFSDFCSGGFLFLPGFSLECRSRSGRSAHCFQSVTTRTAGFNTADLSGMTGASQAIMIVLMMIGGAPGSTAGGMKITTFAVLTANASATFRQREDTQMFGRRVGQEVLKNASTILMMYLFLVLMGGMVISVAENLPISECLFETASAVGTVGLTLGITPQLGVLSKGNSDRTDVSLEWVGLADALFMLRCRGERAHMQKCRWKNKCRIRREEETR